VCIVDVHHQSCNQCKNAAVWGRTGDAAVAAMVGVDVQQPVIYKILKLGLKHAITDARTPQTRHNELPSVTRKALVYCRCL
jgi:hypothetical protein